MTWQSSQVEHGTGFDSRPQEASRSRYIAAQEAPRERVGQQRYGRAGRPSLHDEVEERERAPAIASFVDRRRPDEKERRLFSRRETSCSSPGRDRGLASSPLFVRPNLQPVNHPSPSGGLRKRASPSAFSKGLPGCGLGRPTGGPSTPQKRPSWGGEVGSGACVDRS